MIPLRDHNPTQHTIVVTYVIIAVCVGVFLFVQPEASRTMREDTVRETIEEVEFAYEFAAVPCELSEGRPLTAGEIARTLRLGDSTACQDVATGATPFPDKSLLLSVLVSLFLHADWIHLGGNMLFLWIFGNNVEDRLGWLGFAAFYVVSGAAATAAHVFVQLDSTVPIVGASGAIAGVMGAYLVWYPRVRVRTLFLLGFIPFWPRIPAAALLVLWFVSQFFVGMNRGVAWVAHVGGFLFGIAVGAALRNTKRAGW